MYESVDEKELFEYLSNPNIRHLYLDSSIRQLLAMQLRTMREARGWSQTEVGEKAGGMKQSAIARLEDPQYSRMTLSTLRRLAKAFDVAVIARFAPFSEYISWTVQLDEQRLSPPSFNQEKPHTTVEFSNADPSKAALATDASSFCNWLSGPSTAALDLYAFVPNKNLNPNEVDKGVPVA
jgi:transcriptional regulator with XRE-family HTH domain